MLTHSQLQTGKFDFTWNEFSVKSNEEFGSNISWYYKGGLQVIINSLVQLFLGSLKSYSTVYRMHSSGLNLFEIEARKPCHVC